MDNGMEFYLRHLSRECVSCGREVESFCEWHGCLICRCCGFTLHSHEECRLEDLADHWLGNLRTLWLRLPDFHCRQTEKWVID